MQRARPRSSVHAAVGLIILLQFLVVVGPAAAASHREAPLIALDPRRTSRMCTPSAAGRPGPRGVHHERDSATGAGLGAELLQPRRSGSLCLPLRPGPGRQGGRPPHRAGHDDRDPKQRGARDSARELPRPANLVRGGPPITALDGPGSEGLGLRQTYRVRFRGKGPGNDIENLFPRNRRVPDASGRRLVAVPSNVGPRTMPNYESLAAKGVYDLGHGVRVFIGGARRPSISTWARRSTR